MLWRGFVLQMLLNLHKKSWMEGLTLQDYSEHCKLNETVVKEMLELAKNYNKVFISHNDSITVAVFMKWRNLLLNFRSWLSQALFRMTCKWLDCKNKIIVAGTLLDLSGYLICKICFQQRISWHLVTLGTSVALIALWRLCFFLVNYVSFLCEVVH